MLNQAILVGRLVKDVEVVKEGDKDISYITLAVPRAFKNENGEYDTDYIDCVLWNGIALNTSEYCKKGDLVGIKGRLQTETSNNGIKTTKIIADKVTFLSSKKRNETEEE